MPVASRLFNLQASGCFQIEQSVSCWPIKLSVVSVRSLPTYLLWNIEHREHQETFEHWTNCATQVAGSIPAMAPTVDFCYHPIQLLHLVQKGTTSPFCVKVTKIPMLDLWNVICAVHGSLWRRVYCSATYQCTCDPSYTVSR